MFSPQSRPCFLPIGGHQISASILASISAVRGFPAVRRFGNLSDDPAIRLNLGRLRRFASALDLALLLTK
jgi:hypothetical protein